MAGGNNLSKMRIYEHPDKELADFQSKVLSRLKGIFEANDDKELGDIIGVTRQTISNYRKGKRELSLYKLYKVLKVEKLSFDYVLQGDLEKIKVQNKGDALLKRKLKKAHRLIEMILKVKQEQQKIIDYLVSKDNDDQLNSDLISPNDKYLQENDNDS